MSTHTGDVEVVAQPEFDAHASDLVQVTYRRVGEPQSPGAAITRIAEYEDGRTVEYERQWVAGSTPEESEAAFASVFEEGAHFIVHGWSLVENRDGDAVFTRQAL